MVSVLVTENEGEGCRFFGGFKVFFNVWASSVPACPALLLVHTQSTSQKVPALWIIRHSGQLMLDFFIIFLVPLL